MASKREKKEPLPYYKWLWRDWRSNRKVQRMSWQAKGLYRELLDEFWAEGVLPDELPALADICSCPLEEFEKFWPEIAPRFTKTAAGLVNAKMDEQRTETDSLRAVNSRNGRTGAVAKLATAGDRQATAGDRHIAEQSRAETEQKRSPNERDVVVPPYFDQTMVASGVLNETGMHGAELLRNLAEVARVEIAKGTDGQALMWQMVAAWKEYTQARDAQKLAYTWGAAKFFGEGHWRSPRGWPWKDGCQPSEKPRRLAIEKL